MADFSALKTSIQNYIKQNGNEEITGDLLQQILLSMVSTLGDSAINDLVAALNAEIANRGNADTTLQGNINSEATTRANADTELDGRITTLQGVVNGVIANVENGYVYAGIATPSSTPASGKVFYLALTAGTYTNFGATVVPQGINILKYNGSAWSLDSFLGLDDAPTQGSNNLVKSGGVLDSIIKDGSAFDLSAYNNGTTYADLSAALTALNALPAAYKKGGMSMKYVQTYDNKYVQYFLTKDEWSASEADWEKMNLEEEVSQLGQEIGMPEPIYSDVWNNKVTDTINLDIKQGNRYYINITLDESHISGTSLGSITIKANNETVDSIIIPLGSSGQDIIYDAKQNADSVVIYINLASYTTVSILIKEKIADNLFDRLGALGAQINTDDILLIDDTFNQPHYKTYNIDLLSGKKYKCSVSLDTTKLTGTSTGSLTLYKSGVAKEQITIPKDIYEVEFVNTYDVDAIQIYLNLSAYTAVHFIAKEIRPAIATQVSEISKTYNGGALSVINENTMAGYNNLGITLYKNKMYRVTNLTTMSLSVFEYVGDSMVAGHGIINAGNSRIFFAENDSTLGVYNNDVHLILKIELLDSILMEYKPKSMWTGKTVATYGDSITQINRGDWEYPFNPDTNLDGQSWGLRMAKYMRFVKQYGRGVGGQGYKWNTSVNNIGSHGGNLAWVTNETGILAGQSNDYSYDNYVGHVDIPSGCTAIRGCLCSWLRITKMFPASIKDGIDVVIIMAHNDSYDGTPVAFVEDDTMDTEWAASDYYSKYGGDYNIETLEGGIASAVMKFQAWMPNAQLVLCTPINGRYFKDGQDTDGKDGYINVNPKFSTLYQQIESVTNIHNLFSIPMINVYGNCNINGLNRDQYIYDGIHPYTVSGSKLIAKAMAEGLGCILPKDSDLF